MSRHRAVENRLIQSGLPRRVNPVRVGPQNPAARALIPAPGRGSIERVSVDDDFLGTTFDRNTGSLIHVLNRAVSNWRGIETEKGTRLPLTLTRERFAALAVAYLTAIEGAPPSEFGGLDEGTLAKFTTKEGRPQDQAVSPSEEVYATWSRTHKGIPFREDSADISLCAVTGELIAYNKRYFSKLPPSLEAKTLSDDALSVAKKTISEEVKAKGAFDPNKKIHLNRDDGGVFVSKTAYENELAERRESLKEEAASYAVFIGVEPSLIEPPKLMIVNPNACYTDVYRDDLPGKDKWTPETRLAWVVKLLYEVGATPEQKRHLHMEIWIDAADGKVLGGELPY